MITKDSRLSPDLEDYLKEVRRYQEEISHGRMHDFYIAVPYRENRNDGTVSSVFTFYAKVSARTSELAKQKASSILGQSCLNHQMDGHIMGWVVNDSGIRLAKSYERKLCTDYTLEDKV
jgi:hypothetical protein